MAEEEQNTHDAKEQKEYGKPGNGLASFSRVEGPEDEYTSAPDGSAQDGHNIRNIVANNEEREEGICCGRTDQA